MRKIIASIQLNAMTLLFTLADTLLGCSLEEVNAYWKEYERLRKIIDEND